MDLRMGIRTGSETAERENAEVEVEIKIQSIDPYQSHKENYTNDDNCFYLILDPRRHTETIENRNATKYGPLV
ncbi:hypothetical protein TWF970_009265 [Orbilia oligospora]|uniref:Uncharacterized protein n=1 Tax=Orbilia oligospora TaxID=2813651 RepID=A0A7C8R359_ORBOL|nr:hypothetical protein TWF970_009265 [Orbilia oligospora]